MLNPTFTVKFAYNKYAWKSKLLQYGKNIGSTLLKHKGKTALGLGGLGLATTVGPLNPTGYYDFIKPLFNRKQYKDRIMKDDNVQNYISSVASKAVLNEFNRLPLSSKLKYMKEKFLTSFGVELPKDSFVYRYDKRLKSQLTHPNAVGQMSDLASSEFHTRLRKVRDERRRLDSSVSRDPFTQENIAAAFQNTATRPDGIINNILYTGIQPFVKKEIKNNI